MGGAYLRGEQGCADFGCDIEGGESIGGGGGEDDEFCAAGGESRSGTGDIWEVGMNGSGCDDVVPRVDGDDADLAGGFVDQCHAGH